MPEHSTTTSAAQTTDTSSLFSHSGEPVTPLHEISDASARAVVERMRTINPQADPLRVLPDVHPERVPKHIAFIMDGNGRWAQALGLDRAAGHQAGALAVRKIIRAACDLGVEAVTLYSFSTENWKRPAEEVEKLMELYLLYMEKERDAFVKHNVRFRQIGCRDGLPQSALDALDRTAEATASCTGPTVCLAVNYGSRDEITRAARLLAQEVEKGERDAASIDEHALESKLGTAGLPDPDLLVRTAGELRISNFLLWQISYAEIYVTDTLWPEFDEESLHEAVRAYASRNRKFGGLKK